MDGSQAITMRLRYKFGRHLSPEGMGPFCLLRCGTDRTSFLRAAGNIAERERNCKHGTRLRGFCGILLKLRRSFVVNQTVNLSRKPVCGESVSHNGPSSDVQPRSQASRYRGVQCIKCAKVFFLAAKSDMSLKSAIRRTSRNPKNASDVACVGATPVK